MAKCLVKLILEPLSVFVELVGISAPVVFQCASVHNYVPHGRTSAVFRNELVNAPADFFLELEFFFQLFNLLLLAEIQHEGVFLLNLDSELTGQQYNNHREMNNHGDVQSCLIFPIQHFCRAMTFLLWPK